MEQKEGIDMDEKKTDPSGYEPNFVIKDAAEPEAAENQPNMAENQPEHAGRSCKGGCAAGRPGGYRTEIGFWRIK